MEYVFDAGEQNSPNAVTKENATEIAADFVTNIYHVQVGALETQEFRDNARSVLARLLFGHDQRIKGPMRQLYFVVLSRDGTAIVPRVGERQ